MSDAPEFFMVRVDGAARGNPGPSAAGVVIEDAQGDVVVRIGRLLGKATNNEAEYFGLLTGLEEARSRGARRISVRTDSQLMARQVQGRYKVNAANLRPLFQKARRLMGEFEQADIDHVPREQNSEADRLANLALDGMADVYETPDESTDQLPTGT